jgi:prevent-host-death family protein
VTKAQATFPAMVRAAEKGSLVTVTRRDEPVACLMSYERMCALAETLEIMANPAAMAAVADYREGKTPFGAIDDIPE